MGSLAPAGAAGTPSPALGTRGAAQTGSARESWGVFSSYCRAKATSASLVFTPQLEETPETPPSSRRQKARAPSPRDHFPHQKSCLAQAYFH